MLESRAQLSFFTLSVDLCLLRQLTELDLEVRISWQVVAPHVAVHIGQQASVQSALLFVHDTGRNEIIQSLSNLSTHCFPAHATPDVFFRVLTLRRNSHFPCTTSKLKIFLSDDDDEDEDEDDDDDDENDDENDDDDGDDDDNDSDNDQRKFS